MLGYYVFPFAQKKHRDIISSTPKFYLFDVGIANILMKRLIPALQGVVAGEAFEHYILMEIMAHKGINDLDFEVTFWRTKTGLEVNFILGNAEIAIEIKVTNSPHKRDLKGIIAFQEEHKPKLALVVCLAPQPRLLKLASGTEILILPWEVFIEKLWSGEII